MLKSDRAFFTRRIVIPWDRHKSIALGLIAFSLLGMLVVTHASQNQPVDAESVHHWTVHANYNPHDAKLAIDGRPDTRWTAKQPMKPGMFFQVILGEHPIPIEKLTLVYHQPVDDYPLGYRLETSTDGIHWTTVVPVDVQMFSDAVEIYVKPCKAQSIRITQTGRYQKAWWSIYEVFLYHPSWVPRSYQHPLMLLLFCGLVGSLLFIGLSFCPPFRTGRRSLLLGLILVVIAGLFLRMYMFHSHDFSADEVRYLTEAVAYIDDDIEWAGQAFNKDHRMTPLLYFILTRWLFKISYVSTFAIRIMSALLGTLTILLIFCVWRQVCSRKEKEFEAMLAACILAFLVYHVCWSRDGHGQTQMTFFYILYVFMTGKALATYSRRKRLVFLSGIFLFLGFFFHGSMLVAPIGVLLFAFLDTLLTKLKLPGWQKFDKKNYGFLFLSIVIFSGYLYYALFLKNGWVEAEGWSKTDIHTDFQNFSHFMNFLRTRGDLLLFNLNMSWWRAYGIPHYFSVLFFGLAIIGIGDIILRRQKTEWFMVIQPIFFCLTIASLWHVPAHFERFFLPIVLTMTCSVARGTNVISTVFRTHKASKISRIAISTIVVCYLGFISAYGIFLEQPKSYKFSSYVYRVYSGRKKSFAQLINYIKKSERGSNSIVVTDHWWVFPYANTFNVNVKFLEGQDIIDLIHKKQELPVFVIVTVIQQSWKDLLETLEERYDLVETSFSGNSLYELREDI